MLHCTVFMMCPRPGMTEMTHTQALPLGIDLSLWSDPHTPEPNYGLTACFSHLTVGY